MVNSTDFPYAEEVNYWKTSRSSPDMWMDKTKAQIAKLGGVVLAEGFGKDGVSGRAAYMLNFEIAGEQYKAVWPVLPSKGDSERAARIQATTLLYHDVKAKCISAAVLGPRAAFFSYLMLPDGRTAAEVAAPELLQALPGFMRPRPQLQMKTGVILDG